MQAIRDKSEKENGSLVECGFCHDDDTDTDVGHEEKKAVIEKDAQRIRIRRTRLPIPRFHLSNTDQSLASQRTSQ